MIVKVDIHNVGTLHGVKTPVYGLPMDESLYRFYKEIGFDIELSKKTPQPAPVNAKAVVEPAKAPEKPANPKKKKGYRGNKSIGDDLTQEWLKKPVFTETELSKFTRHELVDILAYRGHASDKNHYDKLNPKYEDTNKDIIAKIIATNAKD